MDFPNFYLCQDGRDSKIHEWEQSLRKEDGTRPVHPLTGPSDTGPPPPWSVDAVVSRDSPTVTTEWGETRRTTGRTCPFWPLVRSTTLSTVPVRSEGQNLPIWTVRT